LRIKYEESEAIREAKKAKKEAKLARIAEGEEVEDEDEEEEEQLENQTNQSMDEANAFKSDIGILADFFCFDCEKFTLKVMQGVPNKSLWSLD
jgi:hypothetical protein